VLADELDCGMVSGEVLGDGEEGGDEGDRYTASEVLNTFVVVYEWSPNGAVIYRPFNPEAGVDAEILEGVARGV
jgi:hypothetical protein